MHTLRVLWVLGPIAISILRDRKRWIWWGTGIKRTPEFHQRRAAWLLSAIGRLGPSVIKISQVFASRADLIPEPYLGALSSVVDQVPALPFEVIRQRIKEEYGRDVDEIFENFEREPVAAASLAQVHRARLNGETVAVKVLRPGVEVDVAADILAFRRILAFLDRTWGHHHIKREMTALAAYETRVREELNFEQEAIYATTIRANFAGSTRVRIPRIYPDLVRRRVLVMEFMEGTRIDRLDTTPGAKIDVTHVVQTLVELYIQMELIDGLFHADPHPGNVMVGADGRIILVDFGAVVRVPVPMRKALVHTSLAAVRRDAEGVTQGFIEMGLMAPGTDPAAVRWIAELLIQGAFTRTTTKDRIQMLLADRVMRTLFDSPIALTQEAVYFARTAALIEGIGTRYDPYFQIVPVASPVVLRMRTKILTSLGESVTPNVDEIATVAGYALGKAARWVADAVSSAREKVSDKLTTVAALAMMLGLTACASASHQVMAYSPAPVRAGLTRTDVACDSVCAPVEMRPEIARAIEARIASLKSTGGTCQMYGEVLERSYTAGLIRLRPYMWRVGGTLASGTARPTGELITALAVDSLNPGVRTLDDVIRSIEHEAAHVALEIPSREPAAEQVVDENVKACRAGLR